MPDTVLVTAPCPPLEAPMWSRRLTPAALALALSACSQTPGPSTAGDRFPLRVEAVTASWALAQDHGDGTCTWHRPSYAVRNGAGVVLDVGDLDGAGEIRGAAPDASCVLVAVVDVPVAADVYDVEVTASESSTEGVGDTFTGSAMISRTTAVDEAVEVVVEGPAPLY